jgi:hypothetical protein
MIPNFSLESSAARKVATTMVVAETESFVAFDQWMTGELDQLVAKWAHTAAPNALRGFLSERRSSMARNM